MVTIFSLAILLDTDYELHAFCSTDSDFNTNSLTFIGPSEFSPNVVLPDSIPELSEGFIIYLEVDRANTDPRDFSRIQFLNRHILAVIEDDDGERK